MALRLIAAVLWFFACWSFGAAGSLYLGIGEWVGIAIGIGIALIILHGEIAMLVRAAVRLSARYGGMRSAPVVASSQPTHD